MSDPDQLAAASVPSITSVLHPHLPILFCFVFIINNIIIPIISISSIFVTIVIITIIIICYYDYYYECKYYYDY